MKRVLVIAALVAAASMYRPDVAQAQTHPCDTPVATGVSTPVPLGVGFCHDGKDVNGLPVVITEFIVKVDGVQVFKGPLVATGPPSATGFSYYETPKNIIVPSGARSVVVFAVSAGGRGADSPVYPFVALDSAPGQVTGVRIIKS